MNLVILTLFWMSLWLASGLKKGPLCGVAMRGGDRVIGGREAEPNEYPWTVSVGHGQRIEKLIYECPF